MSLPSNIVYEILEQIRAPIVDCSNPFSILEHCTLVEPTSSSSKSKNIIATQSNFGATISGSQAIAIVLVFASKFGNLSPILFETRSNPSYLLLVCNKDHAAPQEASLVVDLSPFEVKGKRKPKNSGTSSLGPKTRSSSGYPSSTMFLCLRSFTGIVEVLVIPLRKRCRIT